MENILFVVGLLTIYFAICIRIVPQQTNLIIETFGKYSGTLRPGFHLVFVPFQKIAGSVDLRIFQIKSEVNVKTIDNVFVDLPVSIQLKAESDKASEAFYKLTDPSKQVSTLVLNTIRSTSSGMTLEDMFKDRDQIVKQVSEALAEKLYGYGYSLEAVLIDQPTVTGAVKESFNRVVAAKRGAEAAKQEGEAEKIKLVAVAEAEAQAQRERAKGLADARKTLAEGIAESIETFKKNGISADEALTMLIDINRIDAIREVGKHGNTILVDMKQSNGIALNLAK